MSLCFECVVSLPLRCAEHTAAGVPTDCPDLCASIACRVAWPGANLHAQGDYGVQGWLPVETVLLVGMCTNVQADIRQREAAAAEGATVIVHSLLESSTLQGLLHPAETRYSAMCPEPNHVVPELTKNNVGSTRGFQQSATLHCMLQHVNIRDSLTGTWLSTCKQTTCTWYSSAAAESKVSTRSSLGSA